jgi:hypothetical protein
MISIGQGVAFLSTVGHWNALSDPYSSFKLFILATLVLAWGLTVKPQRGLLTIVGTVYMIALAFFSLIAFKRVCWVGKNLSYFTAVLPSFLVFACYHYSLGDKWEKVANAFILGCCLAAGLGIMQYQPQGNYFNGRAYALVGSPVFLSGTLAMAIPLCLGRLTYLAVPLLSVGIFFTQSRSGILAAVVGVLGYYFAKGVIGIRSLLILCGLALGFVLVTFSGIRDTAGSDRGRYQMMRVAAMAIADNPLTGIGPERFAWVIQQYRDEEFNGADGKSFSNAYTHNHLVEAMLTGGPIFLLVHLLLIGTVGLYAYRCSNAPVFGACLALCAFGLMQPTPLALKANLACLLACLEPSPRPLRRAPFIALAILAFFSALSTVIMSKILKTAVSVGSAQMAVDAYEWNKSAKGEQ